MLSSHLRHFCGQDMCFKQVIYLKNIYAEEYKEYLRYFIFTDWLTLIFLFKKY